MIITNIVFVILWIMFLEMFYFIVKNATKKSRISYFKNRIIVEIDVKKEGEDIFFLEEDIKFIIKKLAELNTYYKIYLNINEEEFDKTDLNYIDKLIKKYDEVEIKDNNINI